MNASTASYPNADGFLVRGECLTGRVALPRDRTRTPRPSDGLALVELITALFIVTFGLLGVITMYHFGLDKMSALKESATAVRAVQNEMETLRALPFAELRPMADGPFISRTPEAAALVNGAGRVTIADYPGAEGRLKQMEVVFTWTGEHGRKIEKALTTLIADKGASP